MPDMQHLVVVMCGRHISCHFDAEASLCLELQGLVVDAQSCTMTSALSRALPMQTWKMTQGVSYSTYWLTVTALLRLQVNMRNAYIARVQEAQQQELLHLG